MAPGLPLDKWLERRFQSNLTHQGVRYEVSLYGPINAILCHIFPTKQVFMVKPQAKLRPLVEVGYLGRLLMDSNCNPVISRTEPEGKKEIDIDEPDFVVTISGPEYGDDIPVAIIKVKVEDEPIQKSCDQIMRYMYHINEGNHTPGFKGYLVCKTQTLILNLPAEGVPKGVMISMPIDTIGGLKESLDEIAQLHWASG